MTLNQHPAKAHRYISIAMFKTAKMEKINILIVDDHPMVLEGLRSLLSGIGYLQIAGIANNAFEAIDVIKNTAVQVAIVDINLPDINGIELTKRVL